MRRERKARGARRPNNYFLSPDAEVAIESLISGSDNVKGRRDHNWTLIFLLTFQTYNTFKVERELHLLFLILLGDVTPYRSTGKGGSRRTFWKGKFFKISRP